MKILTAVLVVAMLIPSLATAQTTQESEQGPDNSVVQFSASSNLVTPLILTGGKRPGIVAMTYEYCANMPLGTEFAKEDRIRRIVIETAENLAITLKMLNYRDEAKFYADCAKKR